MNKARRIPRRVLISAIGGIAIFVLLVAFTEALSHLLYENAVNRERTVVTEKIATIRARLEGEINSTLHLTRGLIAYVATHPEMDDNEFTLLSSEIINTGRNIRNIGLAKDNVITHLYPLVGNEAALGLIYKNVPQQWPQVERAMKLKGTVVAGPVNLVQGGRAFIARTPIYTRSGITGILSKHKPGYWGIASIVIDIPLLYQSAGISQETEGLSIALKGKDATGSNGEIFFGNHAIFSSEPVTQTVALPNGSWQIAGIPQNGWGGENQLLLVQLPRISGWIAAFIIAGLISALLWTRSANKFLALHDPLTGLPNRRLLEDRLERMIASHQRSKKGFSLLFVDLDRFKHINDEYGHKIGDSYLIEVSRRLRSSLRNADTVARIGGDEFVILADNLGSHEEAQNFASEVRKRLLGTASFGNLQLQIRASIGLSIYPEDGDTIDALLAAGDREMYKQKKTAKIHRLNAL